MVGSRIWTAAYTIIAVPEDLNPQLMILLKRTTCDIIACDNDKNVTLHFPEINTHMPARPVVHTHII